MSRTPSILWISILPLLAGCDHSERSAAPWALPDAAGKADGASALLLGSEIPSDFVDSESEYLRERTIDDLDAVGLEGDRRAVLERADGILDASPHDGRVDAAELVQLEQFPHFNLLSTTEREALASLWELYRVPDSATAITPPDVSALAVHDRTQLPGELELPGPLPIDDFAPELNETLVRVGQVFDTDADPTTVGMDDLDAALGFPGAFTARELEDIGAARRELFARAPTEADAVVAITTPVEATEVVSVGPVTFEVTAAIRYEEERALRTSHQWVHRMTYYKGFVGSLFGVRTLEVRPAIADSAELVFVTLDSAPSHAWADDGETTAPGGSFLMEVWEGGERTFATRLTVPVLDQADASLDLSEYRLHRLETVDGEPLLASLQWSRTDETHRGSYVRDYEYSALFRHDVVEVEGSGDFDATAYRMLTEPYVDVLAPYLAYGRYAVDGDALGPIVVDLYPHDAVRINIGGSEAWMAVDNTTYSSIGGDWSVLFRADFDNAHFTHATLTDSLLRIYAGDQTVASLQLAVEERAG